MPGRRADKAAADYLQKLKEEAEGSHSGNGPPSSDDDESSDHVRLARRESSKSYDDDQAAFYRQADAFLKRVQSLGRAGRAHSDFDVRQPDDLPGTDIKQVFPFSIAHNPTVSFTVWWQDSARDGVLNEPRETPDPSDLRVRVQAQNHQDHISCVIVIDCGQPWNGDPFVLGNAPAGTRRSGIFERLLRVQKLAKDQIVSGAVDQPIDRERGVTQETASDLLETAEYLYSGIWDEFLTAFGIAPSSGQSNRTEVGGEIFAETRGLVLPAHGIQTPNSEARSSFNKALKNSVGAPPVKSEKSAATVGVGNFETFDDKAGEPNTVIKAHWPFIRRISVQADLRDFVACGILDWRALYISPLGSSGRQNLLEESAGPERIAPAGSLPAYGPSHDGQFSSKPTRFLFLTKGEPHKKQIGRFIERICAIETMRLFALKNFRTVQNAAVHIRLLGRELDGVLATWGKERAKIDRMYNPTINLWRDSVKRKVAEALHAPRTRIAGLPTIIPEPAAPIHVQQCIDARAMELTDLISQTEEKVISIGAALDYIGQRGSGRLINLIDRSNQFIHEFKRMVDTLEVGNIDTWINYDQFVARGVDPLFETVSNTGRRLELFRERLQSISQVVQTSALIVEADATKSNTQLLRRFADTVFNRTFGWIAISIGVLVGLESFINLILRLSSLLKP